MKKIILTLIVILSAISTNAQKVEELEGRLVPEPSCFEKIIDFFEYDIPYVFEPYWDETWGLGYTYSKFFPIEISANITRWEYFSLGLGVGINIDDQKYQIKNYNPRYYMMISPGVYLRFISINCGIGILSSDYKMTISDTINWGENNGNSSIDGTIHNEISITTSDCHFIVKPSITGYIPICDEEYYITINAGYNYMPKFKELNGWSFGVGFQWLIW